MIEATQLQHAVQEGRLEGRLEGQLEGQLALLTRVMTRRIGEIPTNVMARMKGLNTSQLSDLAEAMFDVTSYDDVETWFTRH
jgi:predicted transposase YdaD